ncbi:hypothetical protein FACS189465_2710 [Clostridia bacterium]|nr:hypothetical protein FACS189465_2710 [Clostridia bacterium]
MKDFEFELKKLEDYGISPIPENAVPTMAYVPYQNSSEIYSAEHGINVGTMFQILDKPFEGNEGMRND